MRSAIAKSSDQHTNKVRRSALVTRPQRGENRQMQPALPTGTVTAIELAHGRNGTGVG